MSQISTSCSRIIYVLLLATFVYKAGSLEMIETSTAHESEDSLLCTSFMQLVIDAPPADHKEDSQLWSAWHKGESLLLSVKGLLEQPSSKVELTASDWKILAWHASAWTLGWALLFYLLCWTQPWWMKDVPKSSKEHENDRYWCARNAFGIIHAAIISCISVPAAISLVKADNYVRFAYTSDVLQCTLDHTDPRLEPWAREGVLVALAALAVITFLVADTVILLIHRQFTPDYVVHHVAFITAGYITRSKCVLPFNGACLLAMEVSTPFLNYILLLRHREGYARSTTVAGIIFFLLFIIFRVCLGIYSASQLWKEGANAFPPYMPKWQVWFMPAAITLCVCVQLYWLPGIVRQFVFGVKGLQSSSVSKSTLREDHFLLTKKCPAEDSNHMWAPEVNFVNFKSASSGNDKQQAAEFAGI